MNAISVIDRELRAESRRTANYWLRVLAAAAIIVVFTSVMLTAALGPSLGADLFMALDQTLSLTFWVVVPLMTADCISREQREGTLGLLFLTSLTFFDVILGKSIIHALRALTLFLAALPVLVLPFVVGGITWPMVLDAVMNQATAVLLGLGAGLFASTKGGSAAQVMAWSAIYALVLALLSIASVPAIMGFCFILASALGLAPSLVWALKVSPLLRLLCRGLVGWGLFATILSLSLRRLKANWQQESSGHEQPRWVWLFSSSDFWQAVFRWDRGRARGRNPIGWLQEYSWTARLTKWGWCGALLAAEFVVLPSWTVRSGVGWQPLFTSALALGVAFSAAGSFRRERDAGLLEILLVTPLSARQLVLGRLWGIFCHYFPALAVLLVFWIGDRLLVSRNSELMLLWPSPLAFGGVMIIGLYLSLGRLNFFLAWLVTWLVGFVLPPFLAALLPFFGPVRSDLLFVVPAILQVLLAALAWFLLYRNVRLRIFLRTETH